MCQVRERERRQKQGRKCGVQGRVNTEDKLGEVEDENEMKMVLMRKRERIDNVQGRKERQIRREGEKKQENKRC